MYVILALNSAWYRMEWKGKPGWKRNWPNQWTGSGHSRWNHKNEKEGGDDYTFCSKMAIFSASSAFSFMQFLIFSENLSKLTKKIKRQSLRLVPKPIKSDYPLHQQQRCMIWHYGLMKRLSITEVPEKSMFQLVALNVGNK